MERFYLGFCNHCQEDVVFHDVSAGAWSCTTCGRTINTEAAKRQFAQSMTA